MKFPTWPLLILTLAPGLPLHPSYAQEPAPRPRVVGDEPAAPRAKPLPEEAPQAPAARIVPESGSGTESKRAAAGQIVLNVRGDGTLVVQQQVMSEAELLQKLQKIASINKKQAIVIRGDVKASYESIFKVLDICRKTGLYHVSFASQSPT